MEKSQSQTNAKQWCDGTLGREVCGATPTPVSWRETLGGGGAARQLIHFCQLLTCGNCWHMFLVIADKYIYLAIADKYRFGNDWQIYIWQWLTNIYLPMIDKYISGNNDWQMCIWQWLTNMCDSQSQVYFNILPFDGSNCKRRVAWFGFVRGTGDTTSSLNDKGWQLKLAGTPVTTTGWPKKNVR